MKQNSLGRCLLISLVPNAKCENGNAVVEAIPSELEFPAFQIGVPVSESQFLSPNISLKSQCGYNYKLKDSKIDIKLFAKYTFEI